MLGYTNRPKEITSLMLVPTNKGFSQTKAVNNERSPLLFDLFISFSVYIRRLPI